MEELIQLLSDYYPLTPELLVTILQKFSKEVHRKNKCLLEPDDTCDWIAFIEKGLVKSYYESDDGTEVVEGFYKEGNIIGFTSSYIKGISSMHTIQVIDEIYLRKIRKVELDAICSKFPVFYLYLLRILETNLSNLEAHSKLLREAPKKRLCLIKEIEPWLLEDKRIKNYMLAAYMGIDKATLSRYRNGK